MAFPRVAKSKQEAMGVNPVLVHVLVRSEDLEGAAAGLELSGQAGGKTLLIPSNTALDAEAKGNRVSRLPEEVNVHDVLDREAPFIDEVGWEMDLPEQAEKKIVAQIGSQVTNQEKIGVPVRKERDTGHSPQFDGSVICLDSEPESELGLLGVVNGAKDAGLEREIALVPLEEKVIVHPLDLNLEVELGHIGLGGRDEEGGEEREGEKNANGRGHGDSPSAVRW